MRSRPVHYNLEHGFVNNWLVAGPQIIPTEEYHRDTKSGITQTPVERGPLDKGTFRVGNYAGSWNYYACREDHLVDHSRILTTRAYLRSWAYTQLVSKTDQPALLSLFVDGSAAVTCTADVWLNGEPVGFQEQTAASTASVQLKKGVNKILVRFDTKGTCGTDHRGGTDHRSGTDHRGDADMAVPHAMALAVQTTAAGERPTGSKAPKQSISVTIPTLIEAVDRRNKIEQMAAAAYIHQDVFEAGDQIRLKWPENLEQAVSGVVRLMTPTGKIYAEATVDGTPGDQLFLSYPYQIPAGPYRILIMPMAWEYYEHNMRITSEKHLWSMGRSTYSALPYDSYAQRRTEALTTASRNYEGLFAAIAHMALGQWTAVQTKPILQAAQDAHLLDILGILGMLYRYGNHEQFPKDLAQPLEQAVLHFPAVADSAGVPDPAAQETGAEDILFYTVEILAGQRYPEQTFPRSGKSGLWHREHGERLALAWLQQCGATGFSDWDSPASFAEYLTALSYLVDLSENDVIWDMAAVIMDKLLFTIAVNSFQGVFGSTHGRAGASIVKGGLLEPTSGITRLMWGAGILNHHIAGPVSLACMEKYELPSIITDIAAAQLNATDEMWDQECHGAAHNKVNKVTYKTPDGMLCSAQDYHPGEKGCQEHIWQATLGAAAAVFVTHPACSSAEDARRPNYWAGNAILPRVAQWKDTLLAIYQLPADDWMGFTHAYFPTHAFDEYVLRDRWAFARKGDGYLALMASQGFQMIRQGDYAFRELRSTGKNPIWLCQLGSAAQDGSFSAFQEKVLAQPITFDNQGVSCTTIRGEKLSFGWQGSFLRNGQEQPLAGFKHYANPYTQTDYPCEQMDIQHGENIMRIAFGELAGGETS